MSVVTYGNVSLPYPFHTDFRQEVVYEDSHTDWMATKFRISVATIISNAYAPYIDPSLSTSASAADMISVLRPKLSKPRQTLSYTVNGHSLLPAAVDGAPAGIDAQNGPKPQIGVLTGITDSSILLTWSVEAVYWEYYLPEEDASDGPINQVASPALSNRWEESVDIDGRNRATRTRSGKCIIRSDNPQGKIADALRTTMAVVGVPPGFLRKRSNYRVDPSGLRLEYTITDEEQYRQPPSPAFEADGHYVETVSKFNTKRYGEAYVKLSGDNNTNQTQLLEVALQVASRKIKARRRQLAAQFGGVVCWIDYASVKMKLYENEVECTLRGMIQPKRSRAQDIVAAFVGIDSTTPLSNPQYQPAYLDYGTSNLILHAAAYYDPSLLGNALIQPGGAQMNNGKEPGSGAA